MFECHTPYFKPNILPYHRHYHISPYQDWRLSHCLLTSFFLFFILYLFLLISGELILLFLYDVKHNTTPIYLFFVDQALISNATKRQPSASLTGNRFWCQLVSKVTIFLPNLHTIICSTHMPMIVPWWTSYNVQFFTCPHVKMLTSFDYYQLKANSIEDYDGDQDCIWSPSHPNLSSTIISSSLSLHTQVCRSLFYLSLPHYSSSPLSERRDVSVNLLVALLIPLCSVL